MGHAEFKQCCQVVWADWLLDLILKSPCWLWLGLTELSHVKPDRAGVLSPCSHMLTNMLLWTFAASSIQEFRLIHHLEQRALSDTFSRKMRIPYFGLQGCGRMRNLQSMVTVQLVFFLYRALEVAFAHELVFRARHASPAETRT